MRQPPLVLAVEACLEYVVWQRRRGCIEHDPVLGHREVQYLAVSTYHKPGVSTVQTNRIEMHAPLVGRHEVHARPVPAEAGPRLAAAGAQIARNQLCRGSIEPRYEIARLPVERHRPHLWVGGESPLHQTAVRD